MRLAVLSTFLFGPLALFAQDLVPTADAETKAAMDAVFRSHFPAGEPGAVALVSVNGQLLWADAAGVSDTRTGTAMRTNGVFRIGSITKQFTATAILQLVQQGLVRLDADIHTYIAFPEKGRSITVEHLLTHTSGIPNYTDLPSFSPETFAKGVTVNEIVDTFKDLPLQFDPGSKWAYSNSGYILLGLIGEAVSGIPWDHYMQERIFDPLGMERTTAAPDNAYVQDEVIGHARAGDLFKEALPLDLSWPYSAGVIRSCLEDMNTWNTAVMNGKVLPAEVMERAFLAYPLSDGTLTQYGYGWGIGMLQGRPTLEHNGGINGFVSSGIYLPKEGVYVIVLANREDVDVEVPACELAAIALGAPYPTTAMAIDPAALNAMTGVYDGEKGVVRYITLANGKLWSQREGSSMKELTCFGTDQFRFVGGLEILDFKRQAGAVIGATLRTRDHEEWMTRTDRPLPTVPAEVKVDAARLKQLAGVYQLMPDFTITVRADGTRLFAQATGQEEFEVYPSSRTTFFYKVVDARIEFLPEGKGKVDRMKLYQGGAELEGKRIK